jgi:hypothetical protein
MSDASSSPVERQTSSKKGVSPTRNIAGSLVLIAVLIVGAFQYYALYGFNTAVTALGARTANENAGLLTVEDTESLLGRSPDGPAVDVKDVIQTLSKQTYTWRGPIKSYTLTAYFTKGAAPGLHHYESEGAKLPEEPKVAPPAPVGERPRMPGMTKKGGGPPRAKESVPAKSEPVAVPAKATADAATAKNATAAEATSTPTDAGPTKAPK